MYFNWWRPHGWNIFIKLLDGKKLNKYELNIYIFNSYLFIYLTSPWHSGYCLMGSSHKNTSNLLQHNFSLVSTKCVRFPFFIICSIGANQMFKSFLGNVINTNFTKPITVKHVNTNNWRTIIFGPENITCNYIILLN